MDPYILTLMNDSLDAWMAEVPEWSSSQGEELMASEDENDLLIAARRAEQQGGNPLFAKNKPGSKSFEQLLKKRSVITIKNMDELCFARALVATKAFVDEDPEYKNISQGGGQQGHRAYKLHQQSDVPEGPCGIPEIEQMQAYLGPQGYQIKIFEGLSGAKWYHNADYDTAPKKLCLLKVEQHFHGLRSVTRALKRGVFLSSM